MPELPDITIYLEALAPRIVDQPLERARIVSPSLLRTVDPPLSAAEGRKVVGLRRLGMRIVWKTRKTSPSISQTMRFPRRRKVVGLRRLGKRIVWEMEG